MRVRTEPELLAELKVLSDAFFRQTGRQFSPESAIPTVRELYEEKLKAFLKKYLNHLEFIDLGGLLAVLSDRRTEARTAEPRAAESAAGTEEAQVEKPKNSGRRNAAPRKSGPEGLA